MSASPPPDPGRYGPADPAPDFTAKIAEFRNDLKGRIEKSVHEAREAVDAGARLAFQGAIEDIPELVGEKDAEAFKAALLKDYGMNEYMLENEIADTGWSYLVRLHSTEALKAELERRIDPEELIATYDFEVWKALEETAESVMIDAVYEGVLRTMRDCIGRTLSKLAIPADNEAAAKAALYPRLDQPEDFEAALRSFMLQRYSDDELADELSFRRQED
jgi:hypothetical protein